MENKVTPRTLSGFMELLPSEQLKFDRIRRIMERVFESYGFFPLDTPVLEASEVLLAKAGGETEKQVYRFKKGDTDMTMRFDQTVPLAKYVAKNAGELTFPFKRYQIGKVYRGERAQKGRFREFYQCDIDIIGDGKLEIANDAEMPVVIYDVLTALGLEDFTFRISNRKVLGGFFSLMQAGERAGDIMRTVDKLEKIGAQKVAEELVALGLDADTCAQIIAFVGMRGTNDEVFAFLAQYLGKDSLFDSGYAELKQVIDLLGAYGIPAKNYCVDLSIARGLDYYTGTVYETTFDKHPEIGSICSGGRYDNLAGFYTSRQLPGVGMAIGLTRLFYVLLHMDPADPNGYLNGGTEPPCDLLVLPLTEQADQVAKIAALFRCAGVRTQVYYENAKFKNKMGYADKLHIPFVLFLGDDELSAGMVKIKNMETGEQLTDTPENLLPLLRAHADAVANRKPINTEKTRP